MDWTCMALGNHMAIAGDEYVTAEEVRWIKHYSSSHKILLVGEGDFSFSACLAKAFASAKNMVATSFDSKYALPIKHWTSTAHLEELRERGCRLLHGVDVNDMHEHPILDSIKFDRIVFNFPHAGHFPHLCERDDELIVKHQELLRAFFRSARRMLSSNGGEVHVSHRNDGPYARWNLVSLAAAAGLTLTEVAEFRQAEYPGYHNKRGGGIRSNKKFPIKDCSFTFKFSAPSVLQTPLRPLALRLLDQGKEDEATAAAEATLLPHFNELILD